MKFAYMRLFMKDNEVFLRKMVNYSQHFLLFFDKRKLMLPKLWETRPLNAILLHCSNAPVVNVQKIPNRNASNTRYHFIPFSTIFYYPTIS